jgi:hypothetical protein
MGKGAVFNSVVRGIDSLQRYLADIPTDKASRFPFFAESYKRHVTDLVRTADELAVRADDTIPTRLLENIERQARDRALHDTKYRLYDVAQLNDMARFFRFVVPFSSAIMDSYIKYSRIIRDNPGVVLQGLYYWEMFERGENVQDENGYVLQVGDGGRERWFSVDPTTGERIEVPADRVGAHRYVQFRLPSDILPTNRLFGTQAKPVFAINKKSFNVFLDLPATGPLVAVPASEFALSHPEFGENAFIKRFVLPFGPSTDWTKIGLPSNVRAAMNAFDEEDGNSAEGHAKAIFQAELIAYGRGERDTPPTFAEARERSAMLRGLRIFTTWISPVSFQAQSPYQPYLDAYRQLRAEDPESADEKFLARHGDEFYALQMTVTRNNAGILATVQSHKAYMAHKELITAYPELAGLITGQAGGSFSKSVYEAQKDMPLRPGQQKRLREIMSIEDSVRALERNRVWDEYTKLMDLITAELAERGLSTMRGARARDLVEMRDQFIATNAYWIDPETGQEVFSPWYEDFTSVDHELMNKRIDSMWEIVKDPDLQKRNDIRGLIDYLHLREDFQRRMRQRGFKTLNSRGARELHRQWLERSFALRERYPDFGRVWSRWLSQDDELAFSKVVSGGN